MWVQLPGQLCRQSTCTGCCKVLLRRCAMEIIEALVRPHAALHKKQLKKLGFVLFVWFLASDLQVDCVFFGVCFFIFIIFIVFVFLFFVLACFPCCTTPCQKKCQTNPEKNYIVLFFVVVCLSGRVLLQRNPPPTKKTTKNEQNKWGIFGCCGAKTNPPPRQK